jgi:hypothetical protein
MTPYLVECEELAMGVAEDTRKRVNGLYEGERREEDRKQVSLLFAALFSSSILIIVVAALLYSDAFEDLSEIYALMGIIIGIANVALIAIIIFELHFLNETLRKGLHLAMLKEETPPDMGGPSRETIMTPER